MRLKYEISIEPDNYDVECYFFSLLSLYCVIIEFKRDVDYTNKHINSYHCNYGMDGNFINKGTC